MLTIRHKKRSANRPATIAVFRDGERQEAFEYSFEQPIADISDATSGRLVAFQPGQTTMRIRVGNEELLVPITVTDVLHVDDSGPAEVIVGKPYTV